MSEAAVVGRWDWRRCGFGIGVSTCSYFGTEIGIAYFGHCCWIEAKVMMEEMEGDGAVYSIACTFRGLSKATML